MKKKFFVTRKITKHFCDDMLDYKPQIPGQYPKKKITFNGKEIEFEDRPIKTGVSYLHSDYSHLLKEVWEEEIYKAIEKKDEERIKQLKIIFEEQMRKAIEEEDSKYIKILEEVKNILGL